MSNLSPKEKTKGKKKSFASRFSLFTMRLNKKSDQNKPKKKSKKSKDILSSEGDGKIASKSLRDFDKEILQTCTFCDYCDREIVVNFTGQKIIYHDSCKNARTKSQFFKESSIEMQTMKPRLTENVAIARETSFVDEISISKSTLYDELTAKMRSSPGVGGPVPFLNDSKTGSYTFSTLDLPTIKQYGITIKNITPELNDIATVYDDTTLVKKKVKHVSSLSQSLTCSLPDNLKTAMAIFNDNDQGLLLEVNEQQLMGKIRVVINLLRPIKMLLTATPPSTFDSSLTDTNNNSLSGNDTNLSTLDRVYSHQEAIFWLPPGTTKLLYININCTTMDVISKLLAKFNIRNNPKKFALYEHTVKCPTEVEVRKLRLLQCPLKIMFEWCTKDAAYFHQNLQTRKFVLQENDPGSIEWEEFSAPELRSFLTILTQEEEEKRKTIVCKYDILKAEICRRIVLKKKVVEETISVYL